MPVLIQFSDDKRYIIYTISEPLEMNDLMRAYEQERAFRDSVFHPVHSIVDMSDMSRIPPNWLTARAGPGLTHPRSGDMLFVGISRGLQIILNTIFRIARYKKMHFFDTREEAVAYAEKNRIEYQVFEPHLPSPKAKSYSDNFRFDRKFPWTH